MTIHISIFRGEDYCPEFSRLGEIRNLIPKHVNVMALTATVIVMLQRHVMETLCMINPARRVLYETHMESLFSRS